MKNRDSQFPQRNSQGRNDRSAKPQVIKKSVRSPVIPVLSILMLAAGMYVYEMPGEPWRQYTDHLANILFDGNTMKHPSSQRQPRSKILLPEPGPVDTAPGQSSSKKALPEVVTVQPDISARAAPVTLDISIRVGFRSVGFRIGAFSRTIAMTDQPASYLKRLPRFTGSRQKYGAIELAGGQRFGFSVDAAPDGYQMYMDRNRNGNLRDDGPALRNQGNGIFASELTLSLPAVTGIPELQGEYKLWLFTNSKSWASGKLHHYCMTQLKGELMLNGSRYVAYLTDNERIDGDYRNDGINIDLNGDGKIDWKTEYFRDGKVALVDGREYRFRITR